MTATRLWGTSTRTRKGAYGISDLRLACRPIAWEFKVTPLLHPCERLYRRYPCRGWVPNQFNVLQYANQSARLYGIDLSGQMRWRGTTGDPKKGLVNYTDGQKPRQRRQSLQYHATQRPINTDTESGLSNIELAMVDDKDDVSSVRNEVRHRAIPGQSARHSQVRGFWRREPVRHLHWLPTAAPIPGRARPCSSTVFHGASLFLEWGVHVPCRG